MIAITPLDKATIDAGIALPVALKYPAHIILMDAARNPAKYILIPLTA